jgi:hypothetical protein
MNEIQEVLSNIVNKICIKQFESSLQEKINDSFIFEMDNNLSSEICDDIIVRFDKDTRLREGVTGGGLQKSIKLTHDLFISTFPEWLDIDALLFKQLNIGLQLYLKKLIDVYNYYWFDSTIKDLGYQMQRYKKNEGFYTWHHDFKINNSSMYRVITFIWYLNDVIEGGETFFLNGKVIPKKGKLVLFPATWTYLHKGNVPISSDKYIITGWFSFGK